MTPKMVRALADANAADSRGGLEKVSGGYANPRDFSEMYAGSICAELVDRDYLWSYLRGERLAITESGRRALADERAENGAS